MESPRLTAERERIRSAGAGQAGGEGGGHGLVAAPEMDVGSAASVTPGIGDELAHHREHLVHPLRSQSQPGKGVTSHLPALGTGDAGDPKDVGKTPICH